MSSPTSANCGHHPRAPPPPDFRIRTQGSGDATATPTLSLKGEEREGQVLTPQTPPPPLPPWPLPCRACVRFADYSGPDPGSLRSPIAVVEQPPRGTPGPAHVFHESLGLPLLLPSAGYVLGMAQPEVPAPAPPSSSQSQLQSPTKALPKSPASPGSQGPQPRSLCPLPP